VITSFNIKATNTAKYSSREEKPLSQVDVDMQVLHDSVLWWPTCKSLVAECICQPDK